MADAVVQLQRRRRQHRRGTMEAHVVYGARFKERAFQVALSAAHSEWGNYRAAQSKHFSAISTAAPRTQGSGAGRHIVGHLAFSFIKIQRH